MCHSDNFPLSLLPLFFLLLHTYTTILHPNIPSPFLPYTEHYRSLPPPPTIPPFSSLPLNPHSLLLFLHLITCFNEPKDTPPTKCHMYMYIVHIRVHVYNACAFSKVSYKAIFGVRSIVDTANLLTNYNTPLIPPFLMSVCNPDTAYMRTTHCGSVFNMFSLASRMCRLDRL